MSNEDDSADLAEYVLGTLPDADRRALDARLGAEPALREALVAWQLRLAPLAVADIAGPGPSPELWDRIAAAISPARAPASGSRTITSDSGTWRAIAPGVDVKLLHIDRARGFRTMLIRMAPGGVIPAHPHADDEECVLIEGEIFVGPTRLGVGDWHLAPKGEMHPDITSPQGGLFYIRAALREHAR